MTYTVQRKHAHPDFEGPNEVGAFRSAGRVLTILRPKIFLLTPAILLHYLW
jgi:hypothetical protein